MYKNEYRCHIVGNTGNTKGEGTGKTLAISLQNAIDAAIDAFM